MSHLFLSHLSKDNNDPTLASDLFKAHANGVDIIIASRYGETGVFEIAGQQQLKPARPVPERMVQGSIF
jgi:hypothetical protein